MRTVRLSKTFNEQLVDLIDFGEQRYGSDIAEQKKNLVLAAIEITLAAHPRVKRLHPDLGLVVYPITNTPFVVLYDFDDVELRVHFVLHRHAALDAIDPKAAVW